MKAFKVAGFAALVLASVFAPLDSKAILVDFETPETGSTLNTTPLIISGLGEITNTTPSPAILGTEILGIRIATCQSKGSFCSLAFGFEVSALSFDLLNIGSSLQPTAEVYDVDGNLLGSSQITDPFVFEQNFALGPFASPIRSIRWFDAPQERESAIDNLRLTPVPAPLPFFGAAAAFGYSRKLKNRIKQYKSLSSLTTSN